MIDKMRELTDGQMQEFVKVLEKRRVPLHSCLLYTSPSPRDA